MSPFRLSRRLFLFFCVTAGLAAGAFLLHSLDSNRQVDSQMITFAFQLLDSLRHGTPGDFLLTVRKYPLFPSLVLAPLYALLLLFLTATGTIRSLGHAEAYLFGTSAWQLYLLSRAVILACGIGTAMLTYKVSGRIFPSRPAYGSVLLLLGSVLFLTFSTAVRPHVPVAAATMLTLFFSLKLADAKTTKNMRLAFGSAALSFCILQSGFFSLVFPIIAFLTVDGDIRWKRMLRWELWAWLAAFGIVSATFGYTFLWNFPLGHSIPLDIDLGHFDTGDANRWSGHGWTVFLKTLFGSELLLTVFALASIAVLVAKKERPSVPVVMILAYLAAYLLCFGMYFNTQGRYAIILLPLLAVLGGRTFPTKGAFLAVVSVCILFTHAELFRLAFAADTYQETRAYLLRETTGTIATDIPPYMLGIPPTRASITLPSTATERFLVLQPDDRPDARPLLPMRDADGAQTAVIPAKDMPPDPALFRLCHVALSSRNEDVMFLWHETIPAFRWLWEAEKMGPDVETYCRKPAA